MKSRIASLKVCATVRERVAQNRAMLYAMSTSPTRQRVHSAFLAVTYPAGFNFVFGSGGRRSEGYFDVMGG